MHLEPEILEIPLKAHDKNPQFILKVKNLTPSPIASLNFSIYHPDKFLFSPERFNLQRTSTFTQPTRRSSSSFS